MKKLISVILSVVMLFSLVIPSFALEDIDLNDYPVVLVAGYSSTSLGMVQEDGSLKKVWGLDFDLVGDIAKENIDKILLGAGKMTQGDYEYLGDLVGKHVVELIEPLRCNPDGSSVYDIRPLIDNNAEACRWSNLPEDCKPEDEIMADIESYIGADNMFGFGCDFRMGAMENAERLDELIKSVRETTGKDKVNVICISHGGQVVGTYLSMFGEQGHVNNVVMCVPAMGGAALAYDIISGNVIFDENTLIKFIEHGFEWENDYHWLTTSQRLVFLDKLIQALLPYVYEILGYWGSIWDFIPSDYLDEALEKLDPVESAPLIAQTKRFHSEIADKYGVNLQKAKDAGANITIISGYGIPSVTGLQEHSDAIIRAKDTSGALCAPFGQRFSDGYKTANTACSDPTHNHLSPSMELDASTCWLPENTWFVNELYHGMQRHDPYSASLMYMQLLSKNPLKSVHESAAYPQFRDSSNPSNPITIRFNHSKPGYLSSEDSSIIISNHLTDSSVDVYGIRAQGVNITFEDFDVRTIKKGRSIEIKFTGDIPEESLTRCAITVIYVANKTITPIGAKQFSFTIMNGAPVEYDESNPFTDADFPIITFDANDRIKNSPFAALIDAIRTLLIKFFKVFVDIMKIIARMN